jgi:type IV pilus assembly protein PilB
MGIYEVMEVTHELRRLVHAAAPSHVLRDQMRKLGVKTLREEGVVLAQDGKCSLEEVLSVTHTEDMDMSEAEALGQAGGSKGGRAVA